MVPSRCARAVYALRAAEARSSRGTAPRSRRPSSASSARLSGPASTSTPGLCCGRKASVVQVVAIERHQRAPQLPGQPEVLDRRGRAADRGARSRTGRPSRARRACSRRGRPARWHPHRRAGAATPSASGPSSDQRVPIGRPVHRFLALRASFAVWMRRRACVRAPPRARRACGPGPCVRARRSCGRRRTRRRAGTRWSNRSRRRRCPAARRGSPCPSETASAGVAPDRPPHTTGSVVIWMKKSLPPLGML